MLVTFLVETVFCVVAVLFVSCFWFRAVLAVVLMLWWQRAVVDLEYVGVVYFLWDRRFMGAAVRCLLVGRLVVVPTRRALALGIHPHDLHPLSPLGR